MVYPHITKDEVIIPTEVPSGTLFVSVACSYGKKRDKDGNPLKQVSLEDCARGYWTLANLKSAHAFECDYLVAHVHGKIVGAWRIDHKRGDRGWMDPQSTPKKTWTSDCPAEPPKRKGCELFEELSLVEKLLGKRVKLGRCGNTLRGYFSNRTR